MSCVLDFGTGRLKGCPKRTPLGSTIPQNFGGDPEDTVKTDRELKLFPTYVGVTLAIPPGLALALSIPHVCGGEPCFRSSLFG